MLLKEALRRLRYQVLVLVFLLIDRRCACWQLNIGRLGAFIGSLDWVENTLGSTELSCRGNVVGHQ